MNCSVRSLDSFMFYNRTQWDPHRNVEVTDLCPDLEHILERHADIREPALQQHDHIVVVLVNLFRLDSLRALCAALLDIRLERRYLLVEVRDVLLDYVCQFLQQGVVN